MFWFSFLAAISRSGAYYGQGRTPILLNNVRCTGTEMSLLECGHNGFANIPYYCHHGRDAGIQCISKHIGNTVLACTNL